MAEPVEGPIPPELPSASAPAAPVGRRRSFWRRPAGILVACGIAVVGLLLLAALALGLGMQLGMLPSDAAVAGAELPASVVDELRTEGVLEPDEQVAYFYSDALFDWLDDGNLFTGRRVIGYWRERGELQVVAAPLANVADIDVAWSDSMLENTEITITCDDGSQFLLVVSREGGGDRRFHDALTRRWREVR